MATNPMQKKVRNSFISGVIITLLICLIIGALGYFLLMQPNQKENKQNGNLVNVCALNKDVKSGEKITEDMLESITVYSNMVPGNYVNKNAFLQAQSENTDIIAKIDIGVNTILTSSNVTRSDSKVTSDIRNVEFNMISLPTTLREGDYIDIRITFPNGQDLIVISKKQVKSIFGNTITLELPEEDILMMESAIVESYIMTSSKIYAIQYVEPGLQTAAANTYTPTEAVQGLIERNSNIVNTAKQALVNKFNSDVRTWTNNEKNVYAIEQKENLETKIQEEIENARAAREAYLSGLTSY